MIRPGLLLWSVIMTKRCYQTIRTNCYLYGIKRENTFKISAYRKAAQSLELDERPLDEISDVTDLKGIGKGVAEVINDYRETGESQYLQQLQEEVPEGLIPLLKIQGLGSKKIAKLYKELNIVDKASLQVACENGKVSELSGFAKKRNKTY